MTNLAKAVVIEVVATVIGSAVWEGYKAYCKFCWNKFSK
jgi:hypothetical protein